MKSLISEKKLNLSIKRACTFTLVELQVRQKVRIVQDNRCSMKIFLTTPLRMLVCFCDFMVLGTDQLFYYNLTGFSMNYLVVYTDRNNFEDCY